MPEETATQLPQPVLEEPRVPPEPALSETETNEEIIAQRLRELGYIE